MTDEKIKELHNLKMKYKNERVYVYECWDCQNLMMMH